MKLLIAFALLVTVAGCSSSEKAAETPAQPEVAAKATPRPLPTTIEEAVNSEFRTADNRPRDAYRHPVETLKFFGLQPNMTVVEITPGNGWYMQILAPLLATNGKYYAAVANPGDSEYMKKMSANIADWMKSHPELEGKVTMTPFNLPSDAAIAPEGTADLVLTFRNVHNWMSKGNEAAAFAAFFKALKPGGVLGVVEHRADSKKPMDPKAKSGYVTEKFVIDLAKKAGFQLAEKSEINANPKDTKDHPEGVWTLPPTYRLGDKDREKYAAIGESDRMTLKFVKPVNNKKK